MADFDLFSLRTTFADQGIMICFNGEFSHSVIEELGLAIKKHLQGSDAPKNRIADVFSVFVEQAQNLRNYTTRDDIFDHSEPEKRSGTLAIAKDGDRYIVSSGNLLRIEDAPSVKAMLDKLEGLDQAELKALYKKRLREPSGDDGGAGLGFIDMSRKAAEPIRYSVRDLADGTAFFNISVVI